MTATGENFLKHVDESLSDYYQRLYELKCSCDETWEQFNDRYFEATGTRITSNCLRKRISVHRAGKKRNPPPESDNTLSDALRGLILDVRKERVKLADERRQNNAVIGRISREETLKEIAESAVKNISQTLPLTPFTIPNTVETEKQGILELSDWHYGIVVDNAYNIYNPDICLQRVQALTAEVLRRLKENNIHKLYVVNLSDMIAGRIHLQLRINSRFDVITQIMNVSEILATMLWKLSQVASIEYYDCDDNHSRVEPSKSDSLELETLTRITKWYLKERFKNNPAITINDNDWGQDIITFNVLGHDVAGVHGDKDTPTKVLDNITLMTRQSYDLCCTAHRHHFACDEKNCCIIVSNGTLMGTDEYAAKLRLSCKPSQNLIVCTKENVCDTLYRILV